MVKVTKSFKKELKTTIKNNFKRFFSLTVIIFLGVSFYVGMRCNAPVLETTMRNEFERRNLRDIEIVSLVGLTEDELKQVKARVPEIDIIEGGYVKEVILKRESDGHEYALAVHSYNSSKTLNDFRLIDGRYPVADNEIVADGQLRRTGFDIGDVITLDDENFKEKKLIIVGFARSPNYISIEKGTSDLLSGKIDFFAYMMESNFTYEDDIYTRGYIKIKTKYKAFTKEYDADLEEITTKIENISKDISVTRRDEVIAKYEKQIQEAEEEYNKQKADAEKKLADAKKQIDEGEEQITKAESQILSDTEVDLYLANVKLQLDNAKAQLDSSKQTLDFVESAIGSLGVGDDTTVELSYLKEKLSTAKKTLTTIDNTLKSFKKELSDNQAVCKKAESSVIKSSCNALSNSIQQKIDNTTTEMDAQIEEIKQLEKLIKMFESFSTLGSGDINEYLKDMKKQYNKALKSYNQGLSEYNYAQKNLKNQMHSAKTTIESKKIELEAGKEQYEAAKKEAEEKLADGLEELNEAKASLDELRDVTWYVLNRNDDSSYSQYYDDIIRIDNLSKVFPIIFYLVAALVTASSISRMVKEERGKIGIFKSLGYNDKQIKFKYLYYASLAAGIGIASGVIVGSYFFPVVFSAVYSLLYFIPDLEYQFVFQDVFIASFLAFLSSTGVAYAVIRSSLKENPYYLLRPKVEKVKSSIIFEKYERFWRKLPFLKKITYRNVFRSGRRGIMTIVGIMGCSALIVTGFGLRDSVTGVLDAQYNKIFLVSSENVLRSSVTDEEAHEELERLNNDDRFEKNALGMVQTVKSSNGNKTISMFHMVPEEMNDIKRMMVMYDPTTNKEISVGDDGVVLTQKAVQLLDLEIGDVFTYNVGNDSYQVRLAGIAENYVYHYMFMSRDLYKQIYGEYPVNNIILSKFADGLTDDEIDPVLEEAGVYSTIIYLSNTNNQISSVIEKFNMIVVIIIVFSGMLAFVVLYNLSMINISERLREIATFKVLGFRTKEVNSYINKEMFIFVFFGIVIGFFFGYFMTELVISTVEMDAIMFLHGIQINSYLYAGLLTLSFTIIVNFFVKMSIRRINMAESLKSIE